MSQDEINACLVEHGATGRRVVRLKGGDPFVFGRGSEEAEALRGAGIEYEVVPGITSAVAAPAYAGIPVTHRGLATHFTVVTGHEDPTKGRDETDWESLAKAGGTLVILMGVGGLPEIVERLLAGGRPADTPAAVIDRGTTTAQARRPRHARDDRHRRGRGACRPRSWWSARWPRCATRSPGRSDGPLHGVTVGVTRARAQAAELVRRLRDLGAGVVEAPVIRIEPIAGPPIDPEDYDLVCLTSPNAPALLLERIGGDARRLAGVDVAAIGPGTAAAIRAIGILPDVVAERAVAEGLLDALATRVAGRRVLVARAEEARDTLPDGLHAARRRARRRRAAVPHGRGGAARRRSALAADLVTFTSSSTVRFFATAFAGRDLAAVRGVSIGPVTSATMRELGIPIVAEAARHDLDGLIEAVIAAAAAVARRGREPPAPAPSQWTSRPRPRRHRCDPPTACRSQSSPALL